MENLPELKFYPIWVLKIYPTNNRVWYLIPWEWINNPDYIGSNTIITNDGVYVYGRVISHYLDILCNKTQKEWFDRYILNVGYDYKDKCPICGKNYKFTKISRGYVMDCDNPNSCNLLIQYKDEEFYSKRCISLNSTLSQAKGRRTQFLQKGNLDDICIFYICMSSDYHYVKYGITICYTYERGRMFNDNKINYHIILTSDRLSVADFEFLIKLELDSIKESLPFSSLSKLIKIIRKIKNKYNFQSKSDYKNFI